MRIGHHELWRRVREHLQRSHALWRLCDGVRCRPGVFGRRVWNELRRGRDELFWYLRQHADRCGELRSLRTRLRGRRGVRCGSVHDGRHDVSGGTDAVQWHVRRSSQQQHELRCVRHGVRRGTGLQSRCMRRNVRLRSDALRRRLRHHPHGSCELRRVWNGLSDRPGLQSRRVRGDVQRRRSDVRRWLHRDADRSGELWRMRQRVLGRTDLSARNVWMQSRRYPVSCRVREPLVGPGKLRRVRHGVSVGTVLYAWHVRGDVPGGGHDVRGHLRESHERCAQLWCVRHGVPIVRIVQREHVRVPDGRGLVRRHVHLVPVRSPQLRLLWPRVHRRTALHARHLRLRLSLPQRW